MFGAKCIMKLRLTAIWNAVFITGKVVLKCADVLLKRNN